MYEIVSTKWDKAMHRNNNIKKLLQRIKPVPLLHAGLLYTYTASAAGLKPQVIRRLFPSILPT
jgi:hypothetical protein